MKTIEEYRNDLRAAIYSIRERVINSFDDIDDYQSMTIDLVHELAWCLEKAAEDQKAEDRAWMDSTILNAKTDTVYKVMAWLADKVPAELVSEFCKDMLGELKK